MTPRPLPSDADSEAALVGACLVWGADAVVACQQAKVAATDFLVPGHGVVFDVIIDLFGQQIAPAVDNVAAELKKRGQYDQVGGFRLLLEVSGRGAAPMDIPHLAEIVTNLSRARQLVMAGNALVEGAFGYCGDFEFAEIAARRIGEILSGRASPRTWAQAVDEAEALTRERMKPPGERDTSAFEISWGLSDFDRHFQPMEPGELVVLGGYTSAGKSSLLRQVLWSIAASGHPVLLETIEVRDAEEAVNLASLISGHRSRSRLHELHSADQAELLASFPTMRAKHFAVSDQDHDSSSILCRAVAFKRKNGLRVMGVDYLQILRDVKKLRPNERPDFAISCVTSELKRFATLEGVAVVLLSGFNRDYIRSNREPRLSDLDGSASIEKDASRVLLLDVPAEYTIKGIKFTQSSTADSEAQPSLFVKVLQAKGRNQGTSSVGLMFRREIKRFEQIKA